MWARTEDVGDPVTLVRVRGLSELSASLLVLLGGVGGRLFWGWGRTNDNDKKSANGAKKNAIA